MKTIIRVPLPYLRNEECFQFYTAFKTLAEQTGVNDQNIGALYATFLVLLGQLDESLEQIRKSGFTDSITDLDNIRDNYHRGITRCIAAYIYHFDPAHVEAAKRLKRITDHYGNLRERPYNEETAAITNLVQDLRKLDGDMQLIHVADWVDKLDEANLNFDTVMNDRYSETAILQQITKVRNIRTEMEATYRKIVTVIEAFAVAMPEGSVYEKFIGEWNVRVEYYKRTIDQRKGKNKKKGDNGEDSGEDDNSK